MAGVREAYRNQGLGRQLKLFQRDEALQRGITLIEWTFDPMELKNAFLNIERLGAIREGALRRHMNVRGYQRDTVYFSILDDEWPAVKRRLAAALES